jgi:hypothetical protein
MEVDGVAELGQLRTATQVRTSRQHQGWLLMDDQSKSKMGINQ